MPVYFPTPNAIVPTLYDFGGVPSFTDFTIDNTPALNRAIAAITAVGQSRLRFPAGVWTFRTKPNSIPCGVHLEGDGFSSSFYQGGTTLYRNYTPGANSDRFLLWDGTKQAANNTGGGLHRLGIEAAAGTSHGVAYGATAQSDDFRPGYMVFEDLLVRAEAGGSFDYAFIGSGVACVTSGSQGLRDLTFRNVYLSGAAVEVAQLLNCTNTNYESLYTFQAGGAATILRISGISNAAIDKSTNGSGKIYAQDLYLDNCDGQQLLVNVRGTLLKTANATRIAATGYAATLTWTDDATSVKLIGTG